MNTQTPQAQVLSETARAHVNAVEQLMAENTALRADNNTKSLAIEAQRSKIEVLQEALTLTQRQLQFYQNFGITLAGKLDAISAVTHDAIAAARAVAGTPAIAPLTQDDEARLADLATSLNQEQPNGTIPTEAH